MLKLQLRDIHQDSDDNLTNAEHQENLTTYQDAEFLIRTALKIKKEQINRSMSLLDEISELHLTFLSDNLPSPVSLII